MYTQPEMRWFLGAPARIGRQLYRVTEIGDGYLVLTDSNGNALKVAIPKNKQRTEEK